MKIKEIIDIAVKKMEKFGLSSPALEAEILLSAVLKKDREYLFSHPEKDISFWQNYVFQRMLKKRLAGYSSAVLIGHKWFYGLDFFVNKNVLVPRPETEILVDDVIKNIQNIKYKIPNTVIDIGTGSGCIVIALAKILKNKNINFYGLDISKKALAVAKKNAKKHKVDSCINFLHSDLLNVIDFKKLSGPIFITANLPYLTPEQIKNSPSIQKEPKMALESGLDGLNHYMRLFKQISASRAIPAEAGIQFLKLMPNKQIPASAGITLFCEIDESQTSAFTELVKKKFLKATLVIKKDLNNLNRLVVISIS